MESKEDMGVLVTEPPPHLLFLSLLHRETFCQQAPIVLDYLHSILQKYRMGGRSSWSDPREPTRLGPPAQQGRVTTGSGAIHHQSLSTTSPRTLLPSWERELILFSGPRGPKLPGTDP